MGHGGNSLPITWKSLWHIFGSEAADGSMEEDIPIEVDEGLKPTGVVPLTRRMNI